MRDFHSLSATEQLYRLAEIAHQPYTRSPRERRACVALIFKLAASTTPPTTHTTPHTPTTPSTAPLPSLPPLPPPPSPPPSPYSRYLDPTPSYSRLIHSLHAVSLQPSTRHSSLHLLFIQRARNPNDRWSGQMALPGGRQQAGETDYHTVVREVEEEVGLQLAASPSAAGGSSEVLYIGRMSDRHINSYGKVKPLAVCPFIFLLTTPNPPALRLDSKEVGAVVWTPLSYFTSEAVRFGYMVHPLVIQTRDRWQRRGGRRKVEVGYRVKRMDSSLSAVSLPSQTPSSSAAAGSGGRGVLPVKLPSLFSLPSVEFPALALPGEFETADGRQGMSLGDTLLYQPTVTTAAHQPSASTASSSASHHSPLLSNPVAPTSSLPIRSGEEPADSSSSSSPAHTSDADGGDGDDGFSSKMEHDIDVAPGTFILWGFTLVLVSDLLRDGLGVRSLSDRIDAGQNDRARMLLWLHRSIDAMERLGRGWKDIRETAMSMLGGGEQDKQDGGQSSQSEKQVAASLSRGIAAVASSDSAKKEGRKEGSPASTSTTQQSPLPSKL